AFTPAVPSAGGTCGLDFNFRDNDNNNDVSQTTVYTWNDPSSGAGFPSKIPDRWGSATERLLEVSIDLGSPDILNRFPHPQNADGNTVATNIRGPTPPPNANPPSYHYFSLGCTHTFALPASYNQPYRPP